MMKQTKSFCKNRKKLAQTEVVDPISLAAKFVDPKDSCCCCGEIDVNSVPENISRIFDDTIVDGSDLRRVFITIGLFTIVRLERDAQLLIPVIDYCIPQNECISTTDSDPCNFFDKLHFPVDEFFPPEKCHFDSLTNSDRRGDHCCD